MTDRTARKRSSTDALKRRVSKLEREVAGLRAELKQALFLLSHNRAHAPVTPAIGPYSVPFGWADGGGPA